MDFPGMYLSYYNLKDWPFQINSDPRFLWLGEKHQEALSTLVYGVLDQRGFVLLTGDVGTGKTTLVNALLKTLDESTEVANITDPQLDLMGFLNLIMASFGKPERFEKKEDFLLHFTRFLHEKYAEKKRILLVVDEAHRLDLGLLEQIRLLSNIDLPETKLISIFLVGQNELNETLTSHECRALRQRITLSCQVEPLSQKETREYIRYRLQVAGTNREIFTRSAVREVQRHSEGYPRVINRICDHALLTGYVKQLGKITSNIVKECSLEILLPGERLDSSLPAPPENRTQLPPFSLLAYVRRTPQETVGQTEKKEKKRFTMNRVFLPTSRKKGILYGVVPACALIILLLFSFLFQVNIFSGSRRETRVMPGSTSSGNQSASAEPAAAKTSDQIMGAADDEAEKKGLPAPAREPEGAFSKTETADDDRSVAAPGPSSASAVEVTSVASETTLLAPVEEALKEGNFEQAIKLSEKIMEREPTSPPRLGSLYANALLGKAKSLLQKDQVSGESLLVRAASANPGNFDVFVALARLYTGRKEYDKAIEAYLKAADLNPAMPGLFFNLGFLYASTDKYALAEEMFLRAIELAPPYLDKAFFNLAVVQEKQGKKEQSIQNLKKALEANPDNQKARELLKHASGGRS